MSDILQLSAAPGRKDSILQQLADAMTEAARRGGLWRREDSKRVLSARPFFNRATGHQAHVGSSALEPRLYLPDRLFEHQPMFGSSSSGSSQIATGKQS